MSGDKTRRNRVIPFSGGVISDAPATEADGYDMENLLPPAGGGRGLVPRDGVEYLLRLETNDTSGHVIHAVSLDDAARTFLVVVSDAATGRVELISDHTDMEGMQAIPPRGGGKLPPYVPPPEPVPSVVPLVVDRSQGTSGEEGLDVSIWNKDRDTLPYPYHLIWVDGLTRSWASKAFRTERYLCYVTTNGLDRCVYSTPIKTLPDSGQTLDKAVVCTYLNNQYDDIPCCWAYANDVIFVLDDVLETNLQFAGPHDHRLYKIHLPTGTVTNVPVTGMPSGMVIGRGFNDGTRSVCTNGYLWAWMEQGRYQTTLVKIDPVSGVVVATKDFTGILGPDTYGFMAWGMAPMPNGEMMVFAGGGSVATQEVSVSADLQTVKSLGLGELGLSCYHGFLPCIIGNKLVTLDENENTRCLTDLTTKESIVLGPKLGHKTHFIVDDNTIGTVMPEDYGNGLSNYLVKFDATTGSTISVHDIRSLWSGLKHGVPDAYAYSIINVQGNRL